MTFLLFVEQVPDGRQRVSEICLYCGCGRWPRFFIPNFSGAIGPGYRRTTVRYSAGEQVFNDTFWMLMASTGQAETQAPQRIQSS